MLLVLLLFTLIIFDNLNGLQFLDDVEADAEKAHEAFCESKDQITAISTGPQNMGILIFRGDNIFLYSAPVRLFLKVYKLKSMFKNIQSPVEAAAYRTTINRTGHLHLITGSKVQMFNEEDDHGGAVNPSKEQTMFDFEKELGETAETVVPDCFSFYEPRVDSADFQTYKVYNKPKLRTKVCRHTKESGVKCDVLSGFRGPPGMSAFCFKSITTNCAAMEIFEHGRETWLMYLDNENVHIRHMNQERLTEPIRDYFECPNSNKGELKRNIIAERLRNTSAVAGLLRLLYQKRKRKPISKLGSTEVGLKTDKDPQKERSRAKQFFCSVTAPVTAIARYPLSKATDDLLLFKGDYAFRFSADNRDVLGSKYKIKELFDEINVPVEASSFHRTPAYKNGLFYLLQSNTVKQYVYSTEPEEEITYYDVFDQKMAEFEKTYGEVSTSNNAPDCFSYIESKDDLNVFYSYKVYNTPKLQTKVCTHRMTDPFTASATCQILDGIRGPPEIDGSLLARLNTSCLGMEFFRLDKSTSFIYMDKQNVYTLYKNELRMFNIDKFFGCSGVSGRSIGNNDGKKGVFTAGFGRLFGKKRRKKVRKIVRRAAFGLGLLGMAVGATTLGLLSWCLSQPI